ncbi:uncharacterized protein LOC114575820 [Exaiptasia diaphana]|uniref:DUF6589 domain-containing protein n=1 Tax=Exaiptasia diaphana TaxID=2652724 RepID=A0A913YQ63_EXADI|nr:uncharacterized protein LOC114575820 [Exaiptasia diaphana]
MSSPSKKTPLGIIFKNENVNEEMISILQQFHTYLPQTGDMQYDSQIFTSDQLTVERAVNTIASVCNGYTAEDRLKGINMQIADWHAGVKILDLIYHRFYSAQSDANHCTMYSDRSLINRRNVTNDTHSNYRANKDFFLLILQSRIILAAMKVLGLYSKESQPSLFNIPADIARKTNIQKLAILHEAAGIVVDQYVFAENNINKLINDVITEQE